MLEIQSSFILQSEGVPSGMLHEGKEHRKEDLCRAQEVDGNVGDRLEVSICEAGQGSAHFRSSFLPRKSKFT